MLQIMYHDDMKDLVCKAVARLGSTRAVCREPGMPDRMSIANWCEQDPEFSAKYARHKAVGIAEFVEETIEIADAEMDPTAVPQAKLRVETRRWLAERMLPKVYGVRSGLDLTNSDGTLQLDEAARVARIAQLMSVAKSRADDDRK